jgi:hypothetical protein
MNKAVFLLLSCISGMVELGGIFYTINNNYSIVEIIGIGLAYQIGNLVPNPLRANKFTTVIASCFSLLAFIAFQFYATNYYLLFIAFVAAAITIQSVRSLQKDNVGTTTKRSFRVLGFLVSPFVGIPGNIAISFLLVGICCFTTWSHRHNQLMKPRISSINLIMIFHQIHYFSYAYFVLLQLEHVAGIAGWSNDLNLLLAAAAFTLGWLTYIAVPHLYTKNTFAKYFIIGHCFVSLLLFLMGILHNSPMFILLWILTGFGGGTVFCIEKMNKITYHSSKPDMVFSENLGHIIGVCTGLFSYLISGHNFAFPYYTGAVFAAITMIFMISYHITNRRRQDIQITKSM